MLVWLTVRSLVEFGSSCWCLDEELVYVAQSIMVNVYDEFECVSAYN